MGMIDFSPLSKIDLTPTAALLTDFMCVSSVNQRAAQKVIKAEPARQSRAFAAA